MGNSNSAGNETKRTVEIAQRVSVIEAQLEGLFRQCFQACQQRAFAGHISQYSLMFDEAGSHVEELQALVHEHQYLRKQEDLNLQSQSPGELN